MAQEIMVVSRKRPPEPIDYFWLKAQFDALHREHVAILKRLEEIETVIRAKENRFNFIVGPVTNKKQTER